MLRLRARALRLAGLAQVPPGVLARALRVRIVHGKHLVRLPPPVLIFYLRAWRKRAEIDDGFSLAGAIKPRELAPLLRAAQGSTLAVEVGTGTGWTALALAVADPRRRVISFDSIRRPQRDAYLSLVNPSARSRVEFVTGPGEHAPPGPADVDLLFIDAAHDRASTLAAFYAWRPRLARGAAVAFHDFDDPQWPGVTEAIRDLGLRGVAHHHLFVWRND